MEEASVLILVRDILGAGLFAALAEGTGHRPVFPFNGERPEIAVERLRPSRILVECYHPAARSDSLFSAADAMGSQVILFAPTAPWGEFEDMARRRKVAFVHPAPGESLAGLVRQALIE
jgi:hypothetical protein